MHDPPPNAIAQFVRTVTGPDPSGPSDSELLNRYAETGDQGAFELLVWRHAGMVMTACRRVLNDRHAAEDATQAAFLALARKASHVRENPAGWLYRVARRIAGKMTVDRTITPRPTDERTTIDPDDVAVLHDELSQLPEKYRLPVLLCFFEGLTHAEAANRLGWPTGSVAGRIARAKTILHTRLTRRGAVIPAAGLIVLCQADGISKSFATTTTHAAMQFASSAVVTVTGLSPNIPPLALGALRAMTIAKVKTVAIAASLFVGITALGAFAVQQTTKQGQPIAGSGGPPHTADEVLPVDKKKIDWRLEKKMEWWLVAQEERVRTVSTPSNMPTKDVHQFVAIDLNNSRPNQFQMNPGPSKEFDSPDWTMRLVITSKNELFLEDLTKDINAYDRFKTVNSKFPSKVKPVWSASSNLFAYIMIYTIPDLGSTSREASTTNRSSIIVSSINNPEPQILYQSNQKLFCLRCMPKMKEVLFLKECEPKSKEAKYDLLLHDGEKEKIILNSIKANDMAVSPDGKLVAIGAESLSVYEIATGQLKSKLNMSDVKKDWPVVFANLVWRHDGQMIAFKPKFVGTVTIGPGQRAEEIRLPADDYLGVVDFSGVTPTSKTWKMEAGKGYVPSHWVTKEPEAINVGSPGMGMGGPPMMGGAPLGTSMGGAGGPPGSESGGVGLPGASPAPPITRLKIDDKAPSPVKVEDEKRIADFGQRRTSQENLKKIMLAMHNYHAAHECWPYDVLDADGKALLSWRVQLLPYFDDAKLDQLYRKFKLNEPWDSVTNKPLLAELPSIYRIGFQKADATDTYTQLFRGLAAFENRKQRLTETTDGVSNTLAIAEIGPAVPWTKPADVPYHPGLAFPKITAPFANAIVIAKQDGSVAALRTTIGEKAWRLFIERDDGQNIDFAAMAAPIAADSKEEKAMLAKRIEDNAISIAALESALADQIALLKLQNAMTTDLEKATQFQEMIQRMIETYAPRNKKLRDEFGLSSKARIPKPEELERKP